MALFFQSPSRGACKSLQTHSDYLFSIQGVKDRSPEFLGEILNRLAVASGWICQKQSKCVARVHNSASASINVIIYLYDHDASFNMLTQ